MTANARALRRETTAEERAIWVRVRQVRPRFTRQLPVGNYILDFACRTLKIAIEIDGSQHLQAKSYDAERTAFLERMGWAVLRFSNSDVRENADGVAEAIVAAVAQYGGPTHPQPLPSREGS
jgi:BirA family biotin operon repressor/biotin-[acetyl-CoA-carboxylase] ligase